MNKDEMIKDIRAIIDDRCEAELGQVHASSKGGKVTKTVDTSLIAKDIYDAGYRKVTEDEIIESMKTYERARQETAKDILLEVARALTKGNLNEIELAFIGIRYGIKVNTTYSRGKRQ